MNPGEDEEFEHEMTINQDIDPDDLIKTMDPAQIEKFIPKRKFEKLLLEIPTISEATCTICIDHIKNGEMLRVIPLCQHVFHAPCLLSWLQVNEICPNCKNEVSIYTLRAYFESLRQKKDSKSQQIKPDQKAKIEDSNTPKITQKEAVQVDAKVDESVANRPVTHSRLQPRASVINTSQQNIIQPRIKIEEPVKPPVEDKVDPSSANKTSNPGQDKPKPSDNQAQNQSIMSHQQGRIPLPARRSIVSQALNRSTASMQAQNPRSNIT